MRLKTAFFLLIIFSIATSTSFGQTDSLLIGFYNVENLFDYFKDSIKNDQDFTPQGIKGWGKAKYEKKIVQTFKAISAIGWGDPPAALGLCEVENEKVLKDLVYGTPLRRFDYRYIHYESNDPRGIDVALLYRNDRFEVLESRAIQVIIPPDTAARTRDLLYVKAFVFKRDTVHLWICHFPSKYGGLMATKGKRAFVGALLRREMELVFQNDPKANLIAMGDFNDEPTDESILVSLGAKCEQENVMSQDLINLMCPMHGKKGSHKFQEHWSIIDQIIVSGNLFSGKQGLQIKNNEALLFDADFLLMDDLKYFGKKPLRTYNGGQYLGGYSDHLPVYVVLVRVRK